MIKRTTLYKILIIITFLFLNTTFAQNGRLLSRKQVDLSKTPVWESITEHNELRAEFRHLQNLDFYFITYESDGLTVNGITIEPKEKGKYPVVIFNRGGNRDFGRLTVATLIRYTSKLAAQGYVVIASNYRERDEFGGADVHDVLYLTETLEMIVKADADRIGMFGWSRGGMMTYLALKNATNIKTAIVGNGPTDLFEAALGRPEMETDVYTQCIPDYNKNRETALKERSVVFWPEKLSRNSSLLILSATADERLNPEQADKIAKKLKEISYDFELKKFDTDHSFSDKTNELQQVVIEWFDKKLKNGMN